MATILNTTRRLVLAGTAMVLGAGAALAQGFT